MNEKQTGGTAFPSGLVDPATPDDAIQAIEKGMTLRDYFAAKAMQGLVAGAQHDEQINLHGAAEWSYNMSDAMLKARAA